LGINQGAQYSASTRFLDCFQKLCGFASVFFTELVYTSGGIDDFLFAGKKRMATGTDFYMQIPAQGGACDEAVATAAGHSDFLIFRVDARFHECL
jgi:hypothetical protein